MTIDANSRKARRNSFAAIAFRGSGAAISFAVNIFITRVLGLHSAGLYFLSLSAVALLSVFGRLGLEMVTLGISANSHSSGNPISAGGTIRTILALSGFASCVIAATLAISSPILAHLLFGSTDLEWPLILISPSIPLFSLWMLIAEALKGWNKTIHLMAISSVIFPVSFGIATYFLIHPFGVSGVCAAYSFATLVAAIGSACIAVQYIKGGGADETRPTLMSILLRGLYFLPQSIFSDAIIPWVPIIILGLTSTQSDVSLYGAASRVTTFIGLLAVSATTATAPQIAALATEGSRKNTTSFLMNSTLWLILLTAPIFAIIAVFPDTIMRAFGAGFSSGTRVLLFLALARFAQVLSAPCLIVLSVQSRHFAIITLSAAGMIILGMGLIALAPLYGAIGAAVALSISMVAVSVGTVAWTRSVL